MDNLVKDIQTLEILSNQDEGLERFSSFGKMQDFVRYYFTRFLINVTTTFKAFSHSEIEQYIRRYKGQLENTLSDPILTFDTIIVPIPKGMVYPYLGTLERLIEVLSHTAPDALENDLKSVVSTLTSNDIRYLPSGVYSRKSFETDKKTLGSMFSKNGLTHTLAKYALVSLGEAREAKDLITSFVVEYYPAMLSLLDTVAQVEKSHDSTKLSPEDGTLLSNALMSLAYRVSIFSMVMKHIQEYEHAFVKSLDVIRIASSKT